MIGTPHRDRDPHRPPPTSPDTPDLIADLGEIIPELPPVVTPGDALDAGVALLNRLAEFGWQIVRIPE